MDATNGLEASQEILEAEVKAFFDSAPPLQNSAEISEKLKAFVERYSSSPVNGKSRRVVCVTSGGTTAPLEQRCVRYIDNFSSGHRGATSTEYFLKAGYAVIFLYRRGSFQPFCRSLPEDPLLECFESSNDSNIQVRKAYSEAVKTAIVEHHAALADGLLLKLPFSTIFEYLQMLQMMAVSMRCLGPHAMFYLAAAVSDFYVPWKDMVEHKIQSGSQLLDVQLVQVPKMLLVLRKEWAPLAFCISFKLETDSNILLKKADAALEKYKMNAVVANELSTRKEEVLVVTSAEKIPVRRDKSQPGNDVENPLIKLLSERHLAYIGDSANTADAMSNCYGFHVLRSLLCLCEGAQFLKSEYYVSKPAIALAEQLNSKAFPSKGADVKNFQSGFPNLLKLLISEMLKHTKMHIMAMQVDQYIYLVLLTALSLLAGNDEELLYMILVLLGCNGNIISECYFGSSFETLDNENFCQSFKNSLFEMELIGEELGSNIEDLFRMGRSVVIAASKKLDTLEHKSCQLLAAAVCSKNESSNWIVPRLLFLSKLFQL